MKNEEKILELLFGIQTDVTSLKQDVSSLKQGQENLEAGQNRLESSQPTLAAGQGRIETKLDKLAVIQNDDIVAIAKSTSEIRQDVNVIQGDVLYLIDRTVSNSKQILELVK